ISAPLCELGGDNTPDGSTYNVTGGGTFTTFFAGRLTGSVLSGLSFSRQGVAERGGGIAIIAVALIDGVLISVMVQTKAVFKDFVF
ncbi:MAG TPA: hypothetical protein PKX17_04925, partial [Candidatus Methanomethylicus sp.]|nr:hypothetical protein [Candidatus Methanomethylicus sp.]